MASVNIRVVDIQGLTPAIDARKQDSIRLISGDNIRFTADGIISDYGNEYLIEDPVFDPEYIQGARIRTRDGDRTFTLVQNAILEYNEDIGDFDVIYTFEDTTQSPYRWTWGFLNGFIFFCHPAPGIIWLSTRTQQTGRLQVPGLPENPLALTVDNGRLIVIDSSAFYWSAQSDGFNFVPSLGGPGFQLINERVSGLPIMCVSFARGVLTLTSGGIMRSEFTGDNAVYRHRAINTEYAPVNSFCIFKTIDDQVVYLDRRGFFASRGEFPQAFAPLWNEFLIDELELFRLTEAENLRVEWDENNRLLYLSVSESDIPPRYDYAYVLYQPLDKWAHFAETHYGIFPINIGSTTERRGQYFGFCDSDGFVRWWGSQSHRQTRATDTTSNFVRKKVEYPVTRTREVTSEIMPCAVRGSTISEINVDDITGYYTQDGLNLLAPNITDLGAKARLGLFRLTRGEYPDEVSEVTDITVGSVLSNDGQIPSVDYNTMPPGTSNEDYNTAVGAEDFGISTVSFVNFDFRVIASQDGRSAFSTRTPQLSDFYLGQRYYAVNIVGVFFILEFSTSSAGQAFYIRDLEVSAIADAGRIR